MKTVLAGLLILCAIVSARAQTAITFTKDTLLQNRPYDKFSIAFPDGTPWWMQPRKLGGYAKRFGTGTGSSAVPGFASVVSTALAGGATPTATISGPPSSMTLIFGIPAGATGATGQTGANGANGLTPAFTQITSTTLASGSAPTATISGPITSMTLTFGIPAGLTGPAGPQGNTGQTGATGTAGANGVSPVIASIVSSSLPAGSQPTAMLSGPQTSLTLTLGIPKGDTGAGGSGSGDMSRSTYDTDNNSKVDDSQRLGGNLPAFYQDYNNLNANKPVPSTSRTVTTPGTFADATVIKQAFDSLGIHRTDINTNRTALANKADAINAAFRTVPASFSHSPGQPNSQITISAATTITIGSQAGDAGLLMLTRNAGTEAVTFAGADTIRLGDGTVRTYRGFIPTTGGKPGFLYYQNIAGVLYIEGGSRDFTPDIAANRLAAQNAQATANNAQTTAANNTTALAGKQATLVSGSNIKTINGQPILGSGDITITGGSGTATKDTLYFGPTMSGGGKSASDPIGVRQSVLDAKQNTLSSGNNIKTVNGQSLLGSGDLVISGGGSSTVVSQVSSVSTLAGLGAATTPQVIFDGSTWTRVAGNVATDPGTNNFYFATQYNAQSDHYERQWMGRAKFEWWKPTSGNTWEQMKFAAGASSAGRYGIQFANGDYYTNERSYITPLTQFYGNSITPDSVRIHITGPNPFWLQNWFWFDGTPGKRTEGIVVDGFSIYNESTFAANRDQNDFYGPISFDGGGAYNVNIRNINYKQVSTTAIVNAILIKMGTNKVGDGIIIDNVRSTSNVVAGRMLVEILNQGDGYSSSNPERTQIPAKNVIIRNCIADNFRFGLSVAGNFVGAYIHNNIVRNCTDYGIEIAGPQPGVRVENNGFGGTQNVLIAGNAEGSIAADYMALSQGQYFRNNYTEGSITGGGIIEIRGGGDLVFTGNTLRIGGGIFIRRTSAGGTQRAEFSNNTIISDATAGNMTNKALLALAGANNVYGSNNLFIRTSSDTQPYVQAFTSSATSGYTATGVASTGGWFFNNRFFGTTVPTTYFSTASGSSLSIANNINLTGLINN